ncbi:MAG: Asp23/Gls24 family envelope stress response protein [Oscillospiraceae bacterium]|nr:Asp23/Gls24 family envelope stress response protein [Oscillospiraceae bacterium]
MAEMKQYITQAQENGTVMISEEVIAAIVTQAAKDVEGVVSIGGKSAVDPKKLWSKDLRITISEANEVSVDCNIVITYGSTVVAVAKAVQDNVYSAIESMTGVRPVSVNINVCGIVRQ